MIPWKLEFFQQDPKMHKQKNKTTHLFLIGLQKSPHFNFIEFTLLDAEDKLKTPTSFVMKAVPFML